MFQSFGIHGPVLGPFAGLAIDVILLGLAFWMLTSPDMKKPSNILTFVTLIFVISLLRVIMAPLPNIQPVTVAALIVGARLGIRRGIAFAVLVTMITNFILGDGIWTLYQAIGWSIVAVIGAKSKIAIDRELQFGRTCLVSIMCAFLFGFIVSLSVIGTVSPFEFVNYLVNGIPFDILHALGNVTIAVWFGPWFYNAIAQHETIDVDGQITIDGYVIKS